MFEQHPCQKSSSLHWFPFSCARNSVFFSSGPSRTSGAKAHQLLPSVNRRTPALMILRYLAAGTWLRIMLSPTRLSPSVDWPPAWRTCRTLNDFAKNAFIVLLERKRLMECRSLAVRIFSFVRLVLGYVAIGVSAAERYNGLYNPGQY